ncbi:MAG TPA: hypothetical protein VN901_11725 [Candidatus Acidoferrales bacterium]|nr:hypothetical protein [Candidatus Acidoferrales bacterium]
MESVVEANKDNYYLALRRTQQTIRKGKQNWEYWLVFFLRTMVKQKNNLAAKVKEEQALRSSLPALSRQTQRGHKRGRGKSGHSPKSGIIRYLFR